MQTEAPASKTRRNLSIAALLSGLIGLLEIGWMLMEYIKAFPCEIPLAERYFPIPSLLGFAFGLIAIRKNGHEASESLVEKFQDATRAGAKRLAIIGVIASVPGLLLTIASVPLCEFTIYRMKDRESAALNALRTIHNNQARYQAIHSRFATLEELSASGLIDAEHASGRPISGYTYSSSDTTAETYCVHADRANDNCGYRDFIVCEEGIIRYVESEVRGTVKRGAGTPLNELSGARPGVTPKR